MKNFRIFYLFATVFVAFMLILASCTKEGPAGPAGEDGTDGTNGTNGTDGVDGTSSCVECHDADATLITPEFQWARSMHNAGTAIARSSSSSCSQCHSDQGFHLSNGNALGEGVSVNDPTTINCYTCHNIHLDYAPSDLDFTYPDIPEWHVTYGKDVSGYNPEKGNLCSHCHQSRERNPVVDMTDLSLMYTGISTHYGPHYSSQANLNGGFGAYEIAGSIDYGNGMHTHSGIENTCVKCHMGFSSASGSGGHGMHVGTSDLEASCTPCHSNGSGANALYDTYYHDNFATIDHDGDVPTLNTTSRYTVLGDLLTAKGVYTKVVDSVGGHPEDVHYNINSGLEINGTLTAAMFNHRFLYQDHSHGMHNPGYARALLQNSLEAVQALP